MYVYIYIYISWKPYGFVPVPNLSSRSLMISVLYLPTTPSPATYNSPHDARREAMAEKPGCVSGCSYASSWPFIHLHPRKLTFYNGKSQFSIGDTSSYRSFFALSFVSFRECNPPAFEGVAFRKDWKIWRIHIYIYQWMYIYNIYIYIYLHIIYTWREFPSWNCFTLGW